MTNYMADVATLFGVELEEVFQIVTPDKDLVVKAKFTEHGLCILRRTKNGRDCDGDAYIVKNIESLLTGFYEVKRIPWKPESFEGYFYVGIGGDIIHTTYSLSSGDINMYKLGNCYKTRELAEANKDKWIQFYKSDEVLEVK